MSANSKKRRREARDVDTQMVEIYEDLTNENSEVRLSATRSILSRFKQPSPFNAEQYKVVINRLIKGLCSGRKAARLGFSVALTELLSEGFGNDAVKHDLKGEDLLSIIQHQTASQGHVSGQDERDHLFGKLFAADAIVESGIFLRATNSLELCQSLFQLIIDLASRKVWLRQECGYLLFKFARSAGRTQVKELEALLHRLAARKMIRTPEGVAIWLLVLEKCPTAQFPMNVWRQDDPLNRKETELLAKVMRDATTKSSQQEDQRASEGAGLWSPQLHFAWTAVLHNLGEAETNGNGVHRMDFATFWEGTVNHGLLNPSSSIERKHWALLAARKVIQESSLTMVSSVLSAEVISCLKNQLASSDRTLHADAKKLCEVLQTRVMKDPDLAAKAVTSLLGCSGHINFDKVTKTRTVEKIIGSASNAAVNDIKQFLQSLFISPPDEDHREVELSRQCVADWLALVSARQSSNDLADDHEILGTDISYFMLRHAYFVPELAVADEEKPNPPLTESTRAHLQLRISSALEKIFRAADKAYYSLCEIMSLFMHWMQEPGEGLKAVVEFDSSVGTTVETSWITFRSLSSSADHKKGSSIALVHLYGIALLQVYGGDADAISILQDLNTEVSNVQGTSEKGAEEDNALADTDSMIEILLSFISKPSKLLRRVGLSVFELITAQITQQGLDSLFKVLHTRESFQGQGDLFNIEDVAQEDETSSLASDVPSASDVEMIDQDQDTESASSVSSLNAISANEIPSSEEDQDGDEDEDDNSSSDSELAAFDAKLAAALGTHRGDQDLEASSDQDMSDSEMEALDTQLSAVFAARQEASKSKRSKQEYRSARENVINFKNRVLDLLEVFFKSQKDNRLALASLAPMLYAAGVTTNTKQIADRIYHILRGFNDRCKRKSHIPPCSHPAEVLGQLRSIHEVARSGTSHAHAIACGNASVLIVRVLSHHQDPHHHSETMRRVVNQYAESTKHFLLSGAIMPGFFTAWNNWYVQNRGVEVGKEETKKKTSTSISTASKEGKKEQNMEEGTEAKQNPERPEKADDDSGIGSQGTTPSKKKRKKKAKKRSHQRGNTS